MLGPAPTRPACSPHRIRWSRGTPLFAGGSLCVPSFHRSAAVWSGKRGDCATRRAVADELIQAALSCLLPLGADHPMQGRAPVPRRLGIEERGRIGARTKSLLL